MARQLENKSSSDPPARSKFVTFIGKMIPLKRIVRALLLVATRLMWWQEKAEEKQIRNTALYLEAADEVLRTLRDNGMPEDELRKLACDLNIPVIQAMMDAMLINRDGRLPQPRPVDIAEGEKRAKASQVHESIDDLDKDRMDESITGLLEDLEEQAKDRSQP